MIDIIVATWNLREISLTTLRTLVETVNVPFRLIIVDNKSDDGLEKDLAKLTEAGIKVIVPEKRISFAQSVNLGLKEANSEYVCFLTNDLIFKQKGWLEKLIETMDSDKRIGFVGCKMLFLNGNVMHGGASYWDWDGSGQLKWRHFGYDQPDRGAWNDIREVPACCMAVSLWRLEAMKDIGYLNEAYQGSGVCVDCELCAELRIHGWKIYYNGTSVVHHRNRSSDKLKPHTVLLEQEKFNMNLFYPKYTEWLKEDMEKNPKIYEGVRK